LARGSASCAILRHSCLSEFAFPDITKKDLLHIFSDVTKLWIKTNWVKVVKPGEMFHQHTTTLPVARIPFGEWLQTSSAVSWFKVKFQHRYLQWKKPSGIAGSFTSKSSDEGCFGLLDCLCLFTAQAKDKAMGFGSDGHGAPGSRSAWSADSTIWESRITGCHWASPYFGSDLSRVVWFK